MGFLSNFVKVFPHLAHRPLHLIGESYAGMYIPYITKAYFEMQNPPVRLAKIAIGDGTIGSGESFELLPVASNNGVSYLLHSHTLQVSILETYPQIIGYDTEVLEYFKEQTVLCGYDLTLEYPQNGHFPTLTFTPGQKSNLEGVASSRKYKAHLTKQSLMQDAQDRFAAKFAKRNARVSKRERMRSQDVWKRDLAGRANGTIDPWYGCDLYSEMIDYAINFTFPWSLSQSTGGMFDVYNIPDALNPEAPMDGSTFLNDPYTRAAIHAPTSKNWVESITYPFGSKYSNGDPSVEPMAFLSGLATNATQHDVNIIIYSGNDDSLIPHLGSQVAIQNTTFGGIQGFTRKPQTPWYNDAYEFAGVVHQERGWIYVLISHAGHLVGYTNPVSALTFIREFVFGNNQTGLVVDMNGGGTTVVGGEVSSLGNEILTGEAGIYYGSATTESTYFFPSATIAAWNAYVETATSYPAPTN
ncbi:hypothetical protein ID866_7052 [Astraeus odoratus]|nr:hypothetical protein ID866_7052 [Astraeus odoratus]